MDHKNPFSGQPGFVTFQIGTRETRAATITSLLANSATVHQTGIEQLQCVLTTVLHQLIAEMGASSMGADDPDAAVVGWVLAEAITHGAEINTNLIQLLGDLADLYNAEYELAGSTP